jgi:hypothetical protein
MEFPTAINVNKLSREKDPDTWERTRLLRLQHRIAAKIFTFGAWVAAVGIQIESDAK